MKKSEEILNFIIKFTQDKGYSPTVREIKDAVSLASTSTVHGHIQRLKKKGLLDTKDRSPRSMTSPEVSKEVRILSSSSGVANRIEWQGRLYVLQD